MSSDALVAVLSHLLSAGATPQGQDPALAQKVLGLLERAVRDEATKTQREAPALEAAVSATFRQEIEMLVEKQHNTVAGLTKELTATKEEAMASAAEADALRKALASAQTRVAESETMSAAMSRIVEKVSAANEAAAEGLRVEIASGRKKDVEIATARCTAQALENDVARLGAEAKKVATERATAQGRHEGNVQGLQSELGVLRVSHEKHLRDIGDLTVAVQVGREAARNEALARIGLLEATGRAELEASVSIALLSALAGTVGACASVSAKQSGVITSLTAAVAEGKRDLAASVAREAATTATSVDIDARLSESTALVAMLRGAMADASRALEGETTAHRALKALYDAQRAEIALLSGVREEAAVTSQALLNATATIRRQEASLDAATTEGAAARAASERNHAWYLAATEEVVRVTAAYESESLGRAEAESTASGLRAVAAAALTERQIFATRCEEVQSAYAEEAQRLEENKGALEVQRQEWAGERRRLLASASEVAQDLAELKRSLATAEERSLMAQVVGYDGHCAACETHQANVRSRTQRCVELEGHVAMLTESFQGLEEIVGAVAEATLRKAKCVLSLPGITLSAEDGLEAKLQVLNTVVDVAVGTLGARAKGQGYQTNPTGDRSMTTSAAKSTVSSRGQRVSGKNY